MEMHKQLKEYFEGSFTGSYLLYEAGLLPFDLLSDIDIRIFQGRCNCVIKYMTNNGWKKKYSGKFFPNNYNEHEEFIFTNKADKPIHIIFFRNSDKNKGDHGYFATIEELITSKLTRGREIDFRQVLIVVENLSKNNKLKNKEE